MEVRNAVSSRSTALATSRETAGVPSTSLVWPSNCGSARRTVTIPVRPSITSSLTTSSPALSSRVFCSTLATDLVSARSNPATWVPPLGVAMMFTYDWIRVSYPSPQRTAMSMSRSRSTSVGSM